MESFKARTTSWVWGLGTHDLNDDPGEISNLSDVEPSILTELTTEWDAFMKAVGIVDRPMSIFEKGSSTSQM